MLANEQLKNFRQKGYLIISRSIDEDTIIQARKSFSTIKNKAKTGKYPFIRVYDDYSFSKNIAGIEMTFSEDILTQEIMDFIEKSNILEYAKSILGNDLMLELSRFHLTENYSHTGIWHRDEDLNHNDNSIQLNLFLYDEIGLQVIDDSHKNKLDEEIYLKKTPHASMNNSKWVKTKAGDILLFDPAVLHRGISEKPRANIHFRFRKCKKDNVNIETLNYQNIRLSNSWENVLKKSSIAFNKKILKEYKNDLNTKRLIFVIIRKFIHNFLFFLPLKSKIFYYFNVWPNLSLRRLFKIKT